MSGTAGHPVVHLVANRLPLAWDDRRGWSRAPGGLVNALASVMRTRRSEWWGAAAPTVGHHALPTWPQGPIHPVQVDRDTYRAAVDGAANRTLWPALHGLDDRVEWREEWWRAYEHFNARFARHVADGAAPGGTVWIHDFHLLLVAERLRRQRPDLRIGISLHTPVVAASVLQIPEVRRLIAGMSGAHVVGVQTVGDADGLRAVLDAATGRRDRVHSSRRPAVVVSPVSVDVDDLGRRMLGPHVNALAGRVRQRADSRLLLVGVDRLDYTKSVLERLDALDLLFREGTLRPDEVDVVQVAQPTRPGVPAYRELRLETERRAHDLSARWIRRDGRPAVTIHFEAWERANVLALLATADVALVTPRRDGMNLVAKEFSLVNERDGVLVLGQGAGVADALGSAAVLVDGARPRSVADGVRRAIDLSPTERRAMAASRRAAVLAWTAADWSAAYLDRLERHDEATSDAAACAL